MFHRVNQSYASVLRIYKGLSNDTAPESFYLLRQENLPDNARAFTSRVCGHRPPLPPAPAGEGYREWAEINVPRTFVTEGKRPWTMDIFSRQTTLPNVFYCGSYSAGSIAGYPMT